MDIALRLILALIFVAGYISSSEKKQTSTSTSLHQQLEGEWLWLASAGDLSGKTPTPASPDEEERLLFGRNATFARYREHVLISSGTYQIHEEAYIHDGQEKCLIQFSSGESLLIEEHTAERLGLLPHIPDSESKGYKRVSEASNHSLLVTKHQGFVWPSL